MPMLLDIAKLLFQKDTRDAVKEAIAFLRKQPDWQTQLEVNEAFPSEDKLKARLLVQFLREALVNKGWKEQRAGVVEYVVQELVDNAYVHGGAAARGGTVRITATLNSQWAQCGVMDSGKGFSLDDALAAQNADGLHGLSQVNALAARLTQRAPAFIEVVVESRAPAIAVQEVDGIYVAQVEGRLDPRRYGLPARARTARHQAARWRQGDRGPKDSLQNPSSIRLALGVSAGDDGRYGSDHAWP
jgi:anti-sigma regulatory factor (Ser/Thr protein kinase)